VLLTFTDTLASALHSKLKRLISSEPQLAERIDIHSLDSLGQRLYKSHVGPAKLADREVMVDLLKKSSAAVAGHKFTMQFLLSEWEHVMDAWPVETWEAYRDVARLGRKTRLPVTFFGAQPRRNEYFVWTADRTLDVHALRHPFGTLLCKGGLMPRTAQTAMRHADIKMTMNVYTDFGLARHSWGTRRTALTPPRRKRSRAKHDACDGSR
jgi:hypothetical protein